jgi:RNA polymerase sigma factor (sigma-70 family)
MSRQTSTDARDDVALLLGSDHDLGAFYARHERPVLGYFLRRTGRPELAADLTAETFARVIESRSRFRAELGEPRAWLFAIARNVLTRSYDLGRVEDAARREVAMQPLVFEDGDLARIAEQSDELAIEALRLLPAGQAEAVKGRIVDELSYDELAAQLGCSPSVVRKRVSRGLRSLRSQLEGRR